MPNIHDVYLSNKVRLYYTDYDIILLLLDFKHMTVTECLTCWLTKEFKESDKAMAYRLILCG